MAPNLRYRINGPNVVHETVEGETININLLTGRYYSLQSTGSEIWSLVQQGSSTAEIARWMSGRYAHSEQHMTEVVQQFLEQLLAEELICTEPTNASTAPETRELESVLDRPGSPPTFVMPVLHKYTDMEDLLLLDPIHEVDDSGWPVAKKDPSPGP